MVRRTLLLLTVALVGLTGLFVPVLASAASQGDKTLERRSEITIRGTYDAPARVSFEYSESKGPEALRVSTADNPAPPPVEPFAEPRLVKGTDVEVDPDIVRPDRSVVEEYSLLELLGIGTGALAILMLL